jgi:hypothetical protein
MPVAIALLILGFRVMKVMGTAEKELIERLPIPFKRQLVWIL